MANTTEKKETVKTEKRVKIKVPRTRANEGDLTVGVNGVMYRIQRGVEVEVPKVVAEVIEQSEAIKEMAYAFNDSVRNK